MTAQNPPSDRHYTFFDFPMERVFDASIDPAQAARFLFATPTGKMVHVEIDARVGGSFNFTRRDGEDVEHVGTYVEMDRPRTTCFHLRGAEVLGSNDASEYRSQTATDGMRINADTRRCSTGMARQNA